MRRFMKYRIVYQQIIYRNEIKTENSLKCRIDISNKDCT